MVRPVDLSYQPTRALADVTRRPNSGTLPDLKKKIDRSLVAYPPPDRIPGWPVFQSSEQWLAGISGLATLVPPLNISPPGRASSHCCPSPSRNTPVSAGACDAAARPGAKESQTASTSPACRRNLELQLPPPPTTAAAAASTQPTPCCFVYLWTWTIKGQSGPC